MHRAARRVELAKDYFVIVKLVGPRTRPIRWTWEIRRRSTSLGLKYTAGRDYTTAQDARTAGEKALEELLQGLVGIKC
jgi:hypothetical protein